MSDDIAIRVNGLGIKRQVGLHPMANPRRAGYCPGLAVIEKQQIEQKEDSNENENKKFKFLKCNRNFVGKSCPGIIPADPGL